MTTMTVETGEETAVRIARQDVAELRGLCPDTAEARRAWARFDAIAGVAWLPDDVFGFYNANKRGVPCDVDRPGLWLGMGHSDGSVWWTDSYRLVKRGGERGWQVPALRDSDETLDLSDWLSGAELGAVRRVGGATSVPARKDAVLAVRDLLEAEFAVKLDVAGKAWTVLDRLATACDAQSPNFESILGGLDGDRTLVAPTLYCPEHPADAVVLEGDGLVVKVNASYLAAFHPDVTLWAEDSLKALRVELDGEVVGALMPVRNGGVALPLAERDGDVLFMRAVADLAASRLWNGKKIVAQGDARLFELVGRLGVLAAGVR